jgi:alkanesulfonate monooxygenase SsuD/methylene tetrahydromethanopterin reductase-like flavin-dependent oxidoreductase (luciferase family)
MDGAKAKPKLGVLLPTRGLLLRGQQPGNANLILNLARKVESAGLDSVWVGDSLTAKPRLEPLAMLAAIASVTERVRLGTAVLLAALRQPVLLAQSMNTVDLISGGRLLVAAGVGGTFNEDQVKEWRSAGVNSVTRASRLEEVVRVVKKLGEEGTATFSGKHFELDSVAVGPKPAQKEGVPILLACHWRAKGRNSQIRRAAQLGDGIISISDTPEEYRQVVEQVNIQADEFGRVGTHLEKTFYLTVNVDDDVSVATREAEDFLTRYYGAEIWGSRWGPFGDTERVTQRMAEYVEAGAETLVVRFASFEPEKQLDIFLDRVAPSFL